MAAIARRIYTNPADPQQRYILWSNGVIEARGGAFPVEQEEASVNTANTKAPTFHFWPNPNIAMALHVIDWSVPSGYTLTTYGHVWAWGGVANVPGGGNHYLTGQPEFFYGLNGGVARPEFGWVYDFEMDPAGNGRGYQLHFHGDVIAFGTGVTAIAHGNISAGETVCRQIEMDWASKRYWVLDEMGRIHGRNGGNTVGYDGHPALSYFWGREGRGFRLYDKSASPSGHMIDQFGRVHYIGSAVDASAGQPFLAIFPHNTWHDLAYVDDGTGVNPLRIAPLEINGNVPEYVVSTAPTVSVQAPADPNEVTTRPAVTWVYSDTEGNPQASWEVAVFTSAQYGVGGFDPETSPATVRASGTGTDTLYQLTEDLANGTYRAYVRATDTTPLASAWAFKQWVQDVTPPPGAVALATNLNGLAGIRVVANVATGEDVSVLWAGAAGSFGATLDGLTVTSQGHPIDTLDVPGATWPAGQGPWFSMLAGDGTLILPSQPLSTNAFQPTGLDLVVGTWLPLDGAMSFEQVLTSTGQNEPLHQGHGDVVGGSDFEGITRVEVGGEERFVLSVGKPWNGWQISVDGIYPTFVVVRKVAGSWVVDYGLSRTAEQVRDSNPAEAADIYIDAVDGIFSEAYVDPRQALELATLPSGLVVCTHYDSAPGEGFTGSAISVLDETLDLLAGYLIPNVEWPTGHGLSVRARGLAACPVLDSDGNDEFAVAYDTFDSVDDSRPGGLFVDGGGASTPDIAAWNVTGVMDVVAKVTLPDYTPGATSHLVAHDDIIGGSRGWSFLLNTDGTLAFFLSSNGTTAAVQQSSAAHGLTNRREYWLGVSYNTATGALAFYKADGAEAMPTRWSGWTLISAHSVTAAVPFNSTAALTIGISGGVGIFPVVGWIHRAAVYDDGTLIADPNFGPDGAPLAVVNAPTYTDSTGKVWTLAGAAYICQASQSLVQVFGYDGTSIYAKSAPLVLRGEYVTNRPTQVCYDDDGNLWVTLVFGGLFNGVTQVFERGDGELSCVAAAPATTAAWLNGDGSTTAEYMRAVTADVAVPGSAVGAAAAGMAWDAARSQMLVSTGTSGLLVLDRAGLVEQIDYHADDAPGTQQVGRPIVDAAEHRAWLPVRQAYTGSYPPASPPALDQWVVRIELGDTAVGELVDEARFLVQFHDPDWDGETWQTVKGAAALVPDASGDAVAVDEQARFGVPRTYRIVTYVDIPPTVFTAAVGPTAAATLGVEGGVRNLWVLSDFEEVLAPVVVAVESFEAEHQSISETHWAAGGRTDPIVLTDGAPKIPRLSANLWAKSKADREAIMGLLLADTTLLLRSPFGDAWYFRVTESVRRRIIRAQATASESTGIRDFSTIAIDVQTVARPKAGLTSGPLAEV